MKERGVSITQAALDMDIHQTMLRTWIRELAADSQQAFPGKGVMKAEIERLKKEVAELKTRRLCDES